MVGFRSKDEEAMDGIVKEMMTDAFEKFTKEKCIEAFILSQNMSFNEVAKQLNINPMDAVSMITAGGKFEMDNLLKDISVNREDYKSCLKAGCDGKIMLVRGNGDYLCDVCFQAYRLKP